MLQQAEWLVFWWHEKADERLSKFLRIHVKKIDDRRILICVIDKRIQPYATLKKAFKKSFGGLLRNKAAEVRKKIDNSSICVLLYVFYELNSTT